MSERKMPEWERRYEEDKENSLRLFYGVQLAISLLVIFFCVKALIAEFSHNTKPVESGTTVVNQSGTITNNYGSVDTEPTEVTEPVAQQPDVNVTVNVTVDGKKVV